MRHRLPSHHAAILRGSQYYWTRLLPITLVFATSWYALGNRGDPGPKTEPN